MSLLSRNSKRRALVVSMCALSAVLDPLAAMAGDIVGRVELVEKNGRKAVDLSGVVLWVDGPKVKPKAVTETVSMKSKNFSPQVMAIGTGSTIEFPNEDPILHNVFSVSGEGFDMGLYKRPKSSSRRFDQPGIYTVYCNIHPQMSALVVVRDNPFFTTAAKDGSFRIEGLPAGDYKLVAYHERSGEGAPLAVKVPAAGAVTANVSLDATAYKRVQHKNKSGRSYSRPVY